MNNELIFRVITLILLVAAFSISGYYRRKADRQGGDLDRSKGQGLLVILRLLALIVILPLLLYLVNPAWVEWARLPLPDWLRWTGGVIAACMVPGFYWLFSSIGNSISPTQATRSEHQLVMRGPYRWIRHPLYTFGFIFFLAISVFTAIWWIGVGLLLVMPLLLWRTPQEEAELVARFGDDYRVYMGRTGRYFPRLSQ